MTSQPVLPFSHRLAWGILALGAAVRIYLAVRMWLPSALWFEDVAVYRDLVNALLHGRLTPEAWIWSPGYPLVAAPFAFLFGAERALVVASLLGGVAAPALILWAGQRSASPRAAAIAAILLTILPEMALASARPLSEAVSLALLVATAVWVAACARRGGLRMAGLGGVAGGLAVLTRPELIFAVAPLALVLARHRSRAVTYAVGAGVVLAPYIIALHTASGAWALSLKPQINALKNVVYAKETDYVAKRLAWARWQSAELVDTDGQLLPRRIVERANVGAYVASAAWLDNARNGMRRSGTEQTALALAGAAGLLVLAQRRREELPVVVACLLPLLAAPFFVQIVGRLFLVGAPALAWSAGALGDAALGALDRYLGGWRSWRRVGAVVVVTIATARSSVAVLTSVKSSRFEELKPEIVVLAREGQVTRAIAAARTWVALEPKSPDVHFVLAEVLENTGHAQEAGESIDTAVSLGGAKQEKAQWLLRQGDVKAAQGVLDQATDPEKKTFAYWSARAQVAGSQRNWEDLGKAAQRMVEIDPTSPLAHFDLGVYFAQVGNDMEARRHLGLVLKSGDAVSAAQAQKVLDYLTKRQAAPK